MCLEDIKIERATKTRVWIATAGVPAEIPPNADRLAVRIICTDTGSAELTAHGFPAQNGSLGTTGVIIGYCFRDQFTGGVDTYPRVTLPDDISLSRVGDILLGNLKLTALVTAAMAIETYLSVSTPQETKNGQNII